MILGYITLMLLHKGVLFQVLLTHVMAVSYHWTI